MLSKDQARLALQLIDRVNIAVHEIPAVLHVQTGLRDILNADSAKVERLPQPEAKPKAQGGPAA